MVVVTALMAHHSLGPFTTFQGSDGAGLVVVAAHKSSPS